MAHAGVEGWEREGEPFTSQPTLEQVDVGCKGDACACRKSGASEASCAAREQRTQPRRCGKLGSKGKAESVQRPTLLVCAARKRRTRAHECGRGAREQRPHAACMVWSSGCAKVEQTHGSKFMRHSCGVCPPLRTPCPHGAVVWVRVCTWLEGSKARRCAGERLHGI
jgi:hypothetical protein